MRFIQITDMHISAHMNPGFGFNEKQKFLDILDQSLLIPDIKAYFFTGDLCYMEGDYSIYKWIRSEIEKRLDCHKYYLAGNHDDSKMLAEEFDIPYNEETCEIYYRLDQFYYPIISIDSSIGRCSEAQISWFSDQLKSLDSENCIIFMHHPPIEALTPFMDINHGFKQSKKFQKMIFNYPKIKFHVFCGHYHVDKVLNYKNMNVYITPATFKQLSSFVTDFKLDHEQPGFRIIDMDDKGQMTTEVRYLRNIYTS